MIARERFNICASNSHFFSELISDSRSLNGFTEGFIKIIVLVPILHSFA